jgi:hypothetical protein
MYAFKINVNDIKINDSLETNVFITEMQEDASSLRTAYIIGDNSITDSKSWCSSGVA